MSDIFISHSSRNRLIADALKHNLESTGIKCWKAPDNILPGQIWEEAIISAIKDCRVVLLVWSTISQESEQVQRELSVAVKSGKVVIPYRIEDVRPEGLFEYYLTNTHWLDAYSKDIECAIKEVVKRVEALLETLGCHERSIIAQPARKEDANSKENQANCAQAIENRLNNDKKVETISSSGKSTASIYNLDCKLEVDASSTEAQRDSKGKRGQREIELERIKSEVDSISLQLSKDGGRYISLRQHLEVNTNLAKIFRSHRVEGDAMDKVYLLATDGGAQDAWSGLLFTDSMISIKMGEKHVADHIYYGINNEQVTEITIKRRLFSLMMEVCVAPSASPNSAGVQVYRYIWDPIPGWGRERKLREDICRLGILLSKRRILDQQGIPVGDF